MVGELNSTRTDPLRVVPPLVRLPGQFLSILAPGDILLGPTELLRRALGEHNRSRGSRLRSKSVRSLLAGGAPGRTLQQSKR